WKNNNLDLVFFLRKNVLWSDGKPFTSNDVVFTFNYIKKYKIFDHMRIWEMNKGLKSVETNGKYKVVFKFSFENKTLHAFITNVLITPKHIWSKIEDPINFTNNNPLGTGPFLFENFSKEHNIIYGIRNPNYWDKRKPYVDAIEIHSVKDNNLCLFYMLEGKADWSYTYVQHAKKIWADKDPENNKYWRPGYNTVIWYLNNEKAPLDNPVFRKALGMSINKKLMSEKVYDSVGEAHPTGIPKAQHNKYLSKELQDISYTYDPQKAQKLLSSIGYTKKNKILIDPAGKKIRNFKICVCEGWTDYIGLAEIIVENLRQIGITGIIYEKPWNDYYLSIKKGTYDTGVCWGEGVGADPYFIYFKNLNKIKEEGNTNFSRFVNDEALKALDNYKESNNPDIQKKSIDTLIKIMLEEVPYIPLTPSTSHNIFSEAGFVGWPSDDNPYADGSPNSQAGAIILSNVHLK
ncbi:MAG: ABC transporter substrate-binding protein, partial [Spirochaetes bacterium]|nr:ABC transporter substrate-binding protein [Spirochaetota bacterium]